MLIITAAKNKKARLIKETGLPAVPLSLTPALSRRPLGADNGGCRAELTPRPLLRRTACSPAPALSPMQAVLFAAGSRGPPVSTLNISGFPPLNIHYILCTVFLQQKYCFRTPENAALRPICARHLRYCPAFIADTISTEVILLRIKASTASVKSTVISADST